MLAAGGALAVVCAAGADLIVPLLYGETYAYAAPAFAVLSLALPLYFLNYALTHQVIGWDGQRAYLAIVAAPLATSVIGNFLLVPERGLVGAAMATLITELVVTVGCVLALVRPGTSHDRSHGRSHDRSHERSRDRSHASSVS